MTTSPPLHRERWHSRGYLIHRDLRGTPQFITIRLYDSLPRDVLERLRAALNNEEPSKKNEPFRTFERITDAGLGSCILARPEAAQVIEDCITFFRDLGNTVHAWVVMPNHVHLFITLRTHSISEFAGRFKSFTAREANRICGRSGPLWARDYFDRVIDDSEAFDRVVGYIQWNPVRAGLVETAADWRFSSAWVAPSE